MIDIRTLTVGSHILANGNMARIEEVIEKGRCNQPWVYYTTNVDGNRKRSGGFLNSDGIQPIPIDGMLLERLGFSYARCLNWDIYTKSSMSLHRSDTAGTWGICCGDTALASGIKSLHELEWLWFVFKRKVLVEE